MVILVEGKVSIRKTCINNEETSIYRLQLHVTIRQLMGQQLNGLSVNELNSLESSGYEFAWNSYEKGLYDEHKQIEVRGYYDVEEQTKGFGLNKGSYIGNKKKPNRLSHIIIDNTSWFF
uniref:Uncharacterized protein n=1 Tax=Leavenworthia alabamica TaxID=310722 RepID=A0A2Z4HJK5_LEAAL|nr:hypothetical protein [Leavenworthia alabamica]